MSNRTCGGCSLCCRLLPVKGLNKPANTRCKHQKFGTGCAVYRTNEMPVECALWNCRWLLNDDCDDLSRPDRSHYVIDMMPEFITINEHNGNGDRHIPVVQIWVDPKHPDAYRTDPALRRYLIRRAEEGVAALIRFNSKEANVMFAPPFDPNGRWHEIKSGMMHRPAHTRAEIAAAIGSPAR